ncbi:MAG: Uma2 family endonuclease [Cyanothece sp. SIO1E1]|nr:Uma2 family endonuclease [Cyanothece sp. SIO1E1]
MAYTSSQLLSLEEFLAQYGNNPRYELADGELIDMEPTGPHETVAGKLTSKLNVELERQEHSWFIPRTCIVRPLTDAATARRPDVIVLDETVLGNEPLWQREPVITLGASIKLIVEVVSTNWETDYARKVEEYALLGIPEYWIVDYLGLGGVAFIGRPKQPTFTVCQLVGEDYVQQQYRLKQQIASSMLPRLALKLDDVLPK